jgi:hypothetical protein
VSKEPIGAPLAAELGKSVILTAIVRGEFTALGEVTVTVPVYVPMSPFSASEPATPTVIWPLPVPDPVT